MPLRSGEPKHKANLSLFVFCTSAVFCWLSATVVMTGICLCFSANAAGEIEVTMPPWIHGTAVAAAAVEYLQGDWPIPSIYAKGSGVPGLPAAPFITTTTRNHEI